MDMGLRVLAFASKELLVSSSLVKENARGAEAVAGESEKEMTFLGLIGLQDPPRPEVPEAIKKCHGAGIRIIMITGDGSRTALAIARQFATIVNAVEEGRTVYENIKKFLTYIFASNIPEAVPYLGYILFNIPLPLTILQILLVDPGTGMLPALALSAEKPTSGVMHQPPRKVDERLLNFPLLARAYLFLGPIEALACMFGFFWVLNAGGWTWGTVLPTSNLLYMQATTACLTAIVVVQVANVFACRSLRESLFTTGLFTNKLIFAAIAVELALQFLIVYHPLGNNVFATVPLPPDAWLMLIPFAILLLAAEEGRKLASRRFRPQ